MSSTARRGRKTARESGPPLLLPTGQVLMMNYGTPVLFTPSGSPKASWAPTIKKCPSTLTHGQTYKITGTQFNGLSMAMAFGDEYQNSTNYPLVRITNNNTKHVFYARTHDHSTMGVATGTKVVFTHFDVPKTHRHRPEHARRRGQRHRVEAGRRHRPVIKIPGRHASVPARYASRSIQP